jgi:hypothetical protein
MGVTVVKIVLTLELAAACLQHGSVKKTVVTNLTTERQSEWHLYIEWVLIEIHAGLWRSYQMHIRPIFQLIHSD